MQTQDIAIESQVHDQSQPTSTYVDEARKLVQNRAKHGVEAEPPKPIPEFFLFYSFDLSNSTKFKIKHPQIWPLVTRDFFDSVDRFMEDHFACLPKDITVKLWKYAGDEVLYYQKVTKVEDCDHAAPITRKVLTNAIQDIYRREEAQELLSVKATVWCARTMRFVANTPENTPQLDQFEGGCRNLVISDDSGKLDFLGPDVDAGFRLAKLASHGRMLLSADLAFLYLKRNKYMGAIRDQYHLAGIPTDLMRIVGFEKLEGVWDNRSYPVVWFEENWKELATTFHYDDHIESKFLKAVLDNKARHLSALEQIYQDRGHLARMVAFVDDVSQLDSPNEDAIQHKKIRAELHCVPVCINHERKVLVAKRQEEKHFLGGFWEFGCGQLDSNQTIDACLAATCRDDFDIEIEKQCIPLPLKHFSFESNSPGDEGRIVPGVIFAVYSNMEPGKAKKHSEIRWLTPAEILTELPQDRCVPDLAKTASLAVQRYSEWTQSKLQTDGPPNENPLTPTVGENNS